MHRSSSTAGGLWLRAALVSAFALLCARSSSAQDLTGIWKDEAGGRYRVRQDGAAVVWVLEKPPEWVVVYRGELDGKVVRGTWTSLPGSKTLVSDKAAFTVVAADRLALSDGAWPAKTLQRITPDAASKGCGLGERWILAEGNWRGECVRRGASDTFDCVGAAGHESRAAVLTAVVDGERVLLTRSDAADGLDCTYTGTLEDDGHTVKGQVACIAAAEHADPARTQGARPFWAAIQCPRESLGLPCADPAGFESHEGSARSRWERAGEAGTYRVWREGATDPVVVRLHVAGAEVKAETVSAPQGPVCRWEGRIAPGGFAVEGSVHCGNAEPEGWSARVRCAAFDPCSDPRGLVLMDRWLREALPPQEAGESLRFDPWGRVTGASLGGPLEPGRPPEGMARCAALAARMDGLASSNLGTLRDFLERELGKPGP